MSKLTQRSTAPKKLNKSEKKNFWRAKKKIAFKHLKRAEKTNNTGWVKMLRKRINKYDKAIGESFNTEFLKIMEPFKTKYD
jgi:hypothetical protein